MNDKPPLQLIGEILQIRIVRLLILGLVLFGVFSTLQWYFFTYRPGAYLEKAYPAWMTFEGALIDAKSEDYRYDPYGALELNLGKLDAAAQAAVDELLQLKPPAKDLRSLQARSLLVLDQYLATGDDLRAEFKTEADYYYTLLLDLRNLFEFRSMNNTILRADISAKGKYYETTFFEYELMRDELGRLLTRVEVARVPSRLEGYHRNLLALLRESEALARQGVNEFSRFQNELEKEDYNIAAGALSSLKVSFNDAVVNQNSVALDGGSDIFSGSIDPASFQSGDTYASFLSEQMAQLGKSQRELENIVAYFDFMADITRFFNIYTSFSVPNINESGGYGTLVGGGNVNFTFAQQWDNFDRMGDDIENVLQLGESITPPSNLAAFHGGAIPALRTALTSIRAALGVFRDFNDTITDYRFRTLDGNLRELGELAARDLDFAEIWNLKDSARVGDDIETELNEVSAGWNSVVGKYNFISESN